MPTGGVDATLDSIRAWFGAGVACVGMGSKLVRKDLDEPVKHRLREILLQAADDPSAGNVLRAYQKTERFDELDAESRAEVVHQVLYGVPRSPDALRPGVPADLARIVGRHDPRGDGAVLGEGRRGDGRGGDDGFAAGRAQGARVTHRFRLPFF